MMRKESPCFYDWRSTVIWLEMAGIHWSSQTTRSDSNEACHPSFSRGVNRRSPDHLHKGVDVWHSNSDLLEPASYYYPSFACGSFWYVRSWSGQQSKRKR